MVPVTLNKEWLNIYESLSPPFFVAKKPILHYYQTKILTKMSISPYRELIHTQLHTHTHTFKKSLQSYKSALNTFDERQRQFAKWRVWSFCRAPITTDSALGFFFLHFFFILMKLITQSRKRRGRLGFVSSFNLI